MKNSDDDIDRLRKLADSLDCLTEEDFLLLADVTPGTAKSKRKRGQGPSYIIIGTRVLYPRKDLAKHLETLKRERGAAQAALL